MDRTVVRCRDAGVGSWCPKCGFGPCSRPTPTNLVFSTEDSTPSGNVANAVDYQLGLGLECRNVGAGGWCPKCRFGPCSRPTPHPPNLVFSMEAPLGNVANTNFVSVYNHILNDYGQGELMTDIGGLGGGITKDDNPYLFIKFPAVTEALLSECVKECREGSSSLTSLRRLCAESLLRPTVFFETAAEHGHIPVCEFLLKNGFSINGDEQKYYSSLNYQSTIEPGEEPELFYLQHPLVSPIKASLTATVRWLLAHGADPSRYVGGYSSNTCIDIATIELCWGDEGGFGNTGIFRMLVEHCMEHAGDDFDWEEMFDNFCRMTEARDDIDGCSPLETMRWLIEQMPEVARKVSEENEYHILKEALRPPLPSLPEVLRGGDELTCGICLEDFAEETVTTRLSCKHKFCTECIDQWFNEERRTCPVCRRYHK